MDRINNVYRRQRGFSLIELLTVIGIFTIVGGLTLPITRNLIANYNFQSDFNTIIAFTYQAKTYAQTNRSNSAWGVYIQPQYLTFYQGESYLSRNPTYDQQINFTSTLVIHGPNEINFASPMGTPSTSPIELTLQQGNQNQILTINAQGAIFY